MRALNSRLSLLASTFLVALTTACSDTPSPASPLLGDVSPALSASTSTTVGDTTVQTFTVPANRSDSYLIDGIHRVDIQSYSICDPATSSYGPTEWDKPCSPLTSAITFTAKSWTDASGHPRVTFSPDVRFVPGKVNTITLKDRSSSAVLANAKIFWCPTNGTCMDEAATDANLATKLLNSGMLQRRIKHFSGYTVIAD